MEGPDLEFQGWGHGGLGQALLMVDPLHEDNVEIVSSGFFPLASGFGLSTSPFIEATHDF